MVDDPSLGFVIRGIGCLTWGICRLSVGGMILPWGEASYYLYTLNVIRLCIGFEDFG